MFKFLLSLTALATLAATTPLTSRTDSPITICCKNVTPASNPAATSVLNGIDVVLKDINVLVGLDCTDVVVIGGETTCGADTQPVTCVDDSHGESHSFSPWLSNELYAIV